MTDSLAQRKFEEFTEIWELTHTKPEITAFRDKIALVGIRVVLIGAAGLSGTRTGSMIAETKQLSRFMETLGISLQYLWVFDAVESVLGFLTIEMTLVLAGYILGDRQTTDKKWYRYFMIAGVLPAFVSNLGPAFHLLGDNFYQFWLVVVNVVVGLATLSLALIAGRVMAVVENEFKEKFRKVKEEWEEAQRLAWYRSTQYKALKKGLIEGTEGKPNVEQTLHSILTANGTIASIPNLIKESGLKEKEVMRGLKQLQKQQKVKVNGMDITIVS
jgi:hypothetical protein